MTHCAVPHRTATFGRLSALKVVLLDITRYVPLRLLEILYNYAPGLGLETAKKNRVISHKFAKELIAEKATDTATGKKQHDVMSILGVCYYWREFPFSDSLVVRANNSQDEKTKMSEYEMVSQIRYFILCT